MLRLPELLAPAGNMERLETAFHFGADAVYVGAKRMSLRNFADNFSMDELAQGCQLAHEHQNRVYVACNVFAREEHLDGLPEFLRDLASAGADALIVTDPGIMAIARETLPQMELHLSTQANTLNSRSISFWHDTMGVKRIVLARELSLNEIATIKERIASDIELELFVHGAMCISYSGRCLLSNYLNGRDSNLGECAQPCRWSYELRERGTDGAYYPIVQDELGTYILNSCDLKLLEYLPQLLSLGIDSLKIEGRMKSIYYVAGVVNAYRMALDAYATAVNSGMPYVLDAQLERELYKISHRPYTTGFLFGQPQQSCTYAGYVQEQELVAQVLQYDRENHRAFLEQRNRFFEGDTLEILSPGDIGRSFIVRDIRSEEGETLVCVPHPKARVWVTCDEPLKRADLLRKHANIPNRTSIVPDPVSNC